MSTDLKRDNSGHIANWAVAERHPLQDLCEGTGHKKVADPYCISPYHTASHSSKIGYCISLLTCIIKLYQTTVPFIYRQ